jgi:hypothetical protein
MFSLNKLKNNFVVILFAVLGNACSVWQSADNQNVSPPKAPFTHAEIKSEIPFSTREPDVYQTEIVVTTGDSEEKMFTARDGNRRRYDFTFPNDSLVSVISDAAGGRKFINHQKKIYADDNLSEKLIAAPLPENWNDFLTADLLNRKINVRFEKISTENNLTKYSIVSSETNAAASETIISIDENLGFPVKSEFYATESGAKVLKFSVEMKNISLQIEDRTFQIPENFRKVSPEEFRMLIIKKNLNEK